MEPCMLGVALSDWFKYHPPTTEERVNAHAKWNKLCADYAKFREVSDYISMQQHCKAITADFPEVQSFVDDLFKTLSTEETEGNELNVMLRTQQIRMLGNQFITFKEIK